MKKTFKTSVMAILACMCVLACAMMMACGGSGAKTYTTSFDSIETWEYSCVNINAFGDENGVGMINLNSWGNKKLLLGADGTCSGAGASWTVELTVEDDQYTLSLICHMIGDGVTYAGEADMTYMFQGASSGSKSAIVCAAPTYAKVTITQTAGAATWGCIVEEYDFANYIPDAGWSLDSNGAKTLGNGGLGYVTDTEKVVAEYLLTTVFGGATFNVSGSSITSITDINFL